MRPIHPAFVLPFVALAVFFLSQTPDTADQWGLERHFGDLAQMEQRRTIRVLTSYSKTGFFLRGGAPHGFDYELMQKFAASLNKKEKRSYDEIKFLYIPVPFDQVLPLLKRGAGDIAMGGLTITPLRKKMVDFTAPYISGIGEVLVCHKDVADIGSLDDLSGREIFVQAGSSHAQHLESLNRHLRQSWKKPVVIREIARSMTTEDLLKMTNAGIIQLTVADSHIANAWARAFPDIRVREDLAIFDGGEVAWAVRRDSPKLKKALDAFIERHKQGSLLGNILYERYFQNPAWIKNPVTQEEQQKLLRLAALFKRYGQKYGFDWLALAAQAYQESGLDNTARSRAGAVGIMQVLPETAKNPPVNIPNFHKLEPNIHAGAKYLHVLEQNYFQDVPEENRMDFLWAAYNAGPTRISSLRREAAARGFDPNKWFFNVEQVAAEKVGDEVVDYVANISMYYLAYKLLYEQHLEKKDAKAELGI
ncbi:lytic transglycosylase F [Salidesulfovibrio onnuriiensis]|uniref:transporter substrate-binding domain-containing protein n=1 Tax=Salidesulfovibrio onnuriiensis TaxID=2583823 RepID=UPI00164FA6A3|nr:lytic transglycosylase F [Salidesulfovibrio onnuriiensis]